MSFPISDALTLIRTALLLLKEEPAILASPEAATYFRMNRVKTLPSPLPPVPQAKPTPPPPRPEAPVEILSGPSERVKTETPLSEELKLEVLPLQEQKTVPQIQKEPRGKDPRPVSQFQSILKKVAPELAILDTIPDDSVAKQIASRWKTKNRSAPISVLSSGELPQHRAFLAEIATALDVHFGLARLIEADSIEKEKQWKMFLSVGSLKLIVICDSTLWQLHSLRQFYKETPADGVRMLGDVPIFLLPDLSLYLKDPLLKRSLWKALCSRLS